jgi:hypothetical protein
MCTQPVSNSKARRSTGDPTSRARVDILSGPPRRRQKRFIHRDASSMRSVGNVIVFIRRALNPEGDQWLVELAPRRVWGR